MCFKKMKVISLVSALLLTSSLVMAASSDDQKITEAVKMRLSKEADIPGSNVKVETQDGKVKLSGTVPTQLQLNKIVELAHSVAEVKKVDSSKLHTASSDSFLKDATITAKVKGTILQLANDRKISSDYNLHVETTNGEVHIFGSLADPSDQKTIIDRVGQIEGVNGVKTNIR
jgi:hyperosmotically inducible protein